ncbi:MAG TPA: hypothetical protein VH500_21930 [Nitrososphaeraceae archaeon]|jgi:hypothetical protein
MIIDVSVPDISVFAGAVGSFGSDITIFVGMTLVYAFSQFIILRYIKHHGQSVKSHMLKGIHHLIAIIQIILVTILLLIIVQMVLFSSYNIILFKLTVWISCATSIVLLGILARKFISWFKSNKNFGIFLYSVAIIALCLNVAFVILTVTSSLGRFGKDEYITPYVGKVANVALLSLNRLLNLGYVITSILSFILFWIATVSLLYYHSSKFGKVKYWILVSIPLVYFLSAFQTYFLSLFNEYRITDPILFGIAYTLFFSATKPVGGLLFGMVFWSVGRSVNSNSIRDYMMVAAYGVMLLLSSNQITGLILAHYPPFGLPTISFLGLACYLVLVGIYSSAISIANDANLRRSMKQTMIKESGILDKIATSQVQSDIQARITTIAEHFSKESKQMYESTGIESSMEEEDIKKYLKMTLQEIEESKKN